MPLTKEQIDQLGYSFYERPQQTGYNQEYLGVGSGGVLQNVDRSTADYLKGLGVNFALDDRSAEGAIYKAGYNTVGGSTINNQFLEGAYGQIASKQAAQAEEARVAAGNAAIKSGNVLQVEQSFPGYTLWNGAFVEKSKIPELQAQGATVKDGNVVGPNVPGLGGQPMSPEQQAAVAPNAPGQPGQPQNQTNAVMADPTTGQPVDATLGANPQQVGGKFGTMNFGRKGTDVFEIMSDGTHRPVSASEFEQKLKPLGLNLDVLPQLDPSGSSTSPVSGATGPAAVGTDPSPSGFLNTYKGIIKDLGLTDIKTKFDEIQGQYDELALEKSDKARDINSNPWLSEGLRVAELRKLDDKYADKEALLTNKMKLYDSLYNEGIAQAKFLATGVYQEQQDAFENSMKQLEAIKDLQEGGKFELREVGGNLYRVDPNTGKSELLIGGGGSGTGGDLSSKEQAAYLSITTKYQADAVINQALKGLAVKGIANQVIANPNSATNQLKALYSLVKNLDPDSAVREGEISLANATTSYLQRFETSLARITKGQTINPDAAKALAEATIEIANLWDEVARRKTTQYQSQANGVSTKVGSSFSDYITGAGLDFSGNSGGDPQADILDTINQEWSSGKYGSREELLDALIPVFKDDFTLDEIGYYIYADSRSSTAEKTFNPK